MIGSGLVSVATLVATGSEGARIASIRAATSFCIAGMTWNGHIATKSPVACFVDFTHPASANGRDYFVGAEFVAGREAHMGDSA